ncbi:Ig-like domain repeat protein [Nocardioides KLBMP 9356]|uniref:Ig-like domain repeat protein n=1 Tax=Nocardioides potassii TaxID=2911371 RepID=A0ABS9H9L6_9ACTN|nr:Ig-like domain repeat protein [Nocardioides potassii]MCF6377906.1 Ig-like domain repeat protein [Nocardioides potassii]
MSVRRLFAGVSTAAVVTASLAVAAPALADPPAGYSPASSDVIGVGSDTSEFALNYLADGNNGVPGWNASNPANKLVSWNATGTSTIPLPSGSATRPNGSGAGKTTLYGGTNNAGNTDIDFARSSSPLNAAEKQAGLQAFPFAKDSLALATAQTSNAPAAISPAQMVQIYSGAVTNWSQLGGAPGVIAPKIPQSGSGTRSFFVAQLQAANNGNPVALAGTVSEVQEHDPSQIQNDPNAVAPFSIGRNAVNGSPLRIEGGFLADRALYNVVRQSDVAKPEILAIFGDSGFICSAAAKPLITAAGFEQLLPKTQGGVCGVPTQDPTTNLATQQIATTTTVAGTSAAAGALTVTATVASGSSVANGLVSFFLDGAATPTGTPVPLTGGKATKALTGLSAGGHTVVAKYTPSTNSVFLPSQSSATAVTVAASTPAPPVVVKAKTVLKETYKTSYAKGATVKGKVKVTESAAGAATGKVVVKRGTKTVGKGTVKNGVVTITLKKLAKGRNKLVASYAGDAAFAASKLKFTITIKG